MAENDAGRFHSIVAGLQRNSITLLSTSSGRWLTSVKKSIEEYLRTLHLKVNDETRTKISNGPWTVNEGEHFIILHGAEGGKSIKVASQITSLPPNRVAVVVKSRHVSALEGLSAKDHLRVKIDKTGQEKVLEVCHRILVVFGAPQIKAAEADNVKWSEDPVMVTLRKEKDISLGLSIVSRQVHSSSPVGSITLIRKIDGPPGSAASEKLKKFMHIQSVNGLLLDGLSSLEASEVIQCIEEGPVFLMVRPASKDWTKIGSPSTPIAGTPLGTPVRTPSGPPSLPPPQPPPPSMYKGVCRFSMRPFELKWIEKAADVQLNTETLHLIPALITEPKSQQRKATIIGYADNHLVRSDTKGDLILAVNGVEVLRKTPHEVKKMIRETRHGALVSLTLYHCEEGPRTLAENVYSDIVQSYRPAQDQDVVATHDDEDLGFEESQDPSLEPVVVPCYRAISVYFTGSNRECNTRLYNMMTKADSMVDYRSRNERSYLTESSREEISLSLVANLHDSCLSKYHSISSQQLGGFSQGYGQLMSSSNSPLNTSHKLLPSESHTSGVSSADSYSIPPMTSGSHTVIRSPNGAHTDHRILSSWSPISLRITKSNSSCSSPLTLSSGYHYTSLSSIDSMSSCSLLTKEEPSLLTRKCMDDNWNPLPSLIHPPNSLDSRKWFLLQNVDYYQLQSKQITLCPLQELLYLKSNTICVYAINLEDLTLSPHTAYTQIYDFLRFFQLRHRPKGRQVVLVGAYDSQTEYGRTLDDKKLEWLHKHISKVLQNKCVNEVLLEDLQKKRIHLIPFDLANPEEKTSDLQHVINDCVNKYDLRVEPTSTGSEGTPQSLKQWPLFWKMVMEMSLYQHLISKEELRKLASKVLWIEDGPLFEQCLECLDQTSLIRVHGPDDNSGFLTSPDLIVKLIANLADPRILRGILQRASKLESAQLETFAYITEKGLQKTIQDLFFGLSNGECASLVRWMKHLKVALPANSGATQDSSLFIPAITTSHHWLVRSDAFVSEEGVELFIELPESATLLFFHDLIVRLLPQTGQKEALILNRACAKVRIPKLSLLPCYPMFDVVLQYSTIQSHIRVLIKPWQTDLVSMAEKFFRDLISEMDPSMQSHLIIGPRFDDPKALSCARSRATFDFLDEVQQGPPSTSVEETSPTYVVNASALRQLISKGFEPKVAIESKPGYYNYFPVSKIPGLNQWVYDSRYLYGEKSEENKDLLLMRALSTVAEWLLPEPQTCVSIACENGIVSPLGPEALSWAGNVGEPTAYKLIRMWQSRKLPISRLHDALVYHHHNAAASELAPFCHNVSKTANEDTNKLKEQSPSLHQQIRSIHDSEKVLNKISWIPFGVRTLPVDPQGCLYQLWDDNTISCGQKSSGYIEIPQNAFVAENQNIHCALILHGPFSPPSGYQFASPIVYISFDTTHNNKPITLHLPHWYGGKIEDQIVDGLTFVMAPHSLRDGEASYQFEPFPGGEFLIHEGYLSITGHNSLFAIAFKNGGKSLYFATSLTKEEEGHICNDVVITYAHPVWNQIFGKYCTEWCIKKMQLFSFDEGKILRVVGFPKSGPGWTANVHGTKQVKESCVSYSESGISDEAELEEAVSIGVYPPRISCEVVYKAVSVEYSRPELVCLEIAGTDKGSMNFLCKISILNVSCETSNGFLANGKDQHCAPNGIDKKALSQFLLNHQQDFVKYAEAKSIALSLKCERLIPEKVATQVEQAQTRKDANCLLFEHLVNQGGTCTLQQIFGIMKNELGYDQMNRLGQEMDYNFHLLISTHH